MLVLSRKTGESIVIGGGVTVTVRNIGHGKVSLGVQAPASVSIDRLEVHQAKNSSNKEAVDYGRLLSDQDPTDLET